MRLMKCLRCWFAVGQNCLRGGQVVIERTIRWNCLVMVMVTVSKWENPEFDHHPPIDALSANLSPFPQIRDLLSSQGRTSQVPVPSYKVPVCRANRKPSEKERRVERGKTKQNKQLKTNERVFIRILRRYLEGLLTWTSRV